MLASYQKPFRVDQVFETHTAALDAELHVAHYILLGGPGETRETIRETLSNAEKHTRTVLFFFCGIRIYPYTKIYDLALQEGQISVSDDLLEPVFYQSRFIKAEEIQRLVEQQAKGRENWIIGSGGYQAARLMARLHQKGYIGPLWEYMIRGVSGSRSVLKLPAPRCGEGARYPCSREIRPGRFIFLLTGFKQYGLTIFFQASPGLPGSIRPPAITKCPKQTV